MLSQRRMVRLTVVLTASLPRATRLVEALRSLMVGTRLESGCLSCSAWSEPDSSVHYFEEWATEADLKRRVRSDRFTSLLAVMEAAEEPPQVTIDFSTKTRGLDYIAEVRRVTDRPA
jgi:quinol monooxygenase YgiN